MSKLQHVILMAICGFCLLFSVLIVILNSLNKGQANDLNQRQAFVNQGAQCQQRLQGIAMAVGEKSLTNYRMKELLAKYGMSFKPSADAGKEAGK